MGTGQLPVFDKFWRDNISPDIQDPNETSLDDLRKIYDESNLSAARSVLDNSFSKRLNALKEEIKKYIGKEHMAKPERPSGELEIFEPFGLLSNKCMDEIMAMAIDRVMLVDNINKAKDEIDIETIANDCIFNISHTREKETGIVSDLGALAEATLFNDIYLLWSIRRSILEAFKYHQWFVTRRDDEEELDRMQMEFVKDYNDPRVKW